MIITSVNNELVKETTKLLKNKYREETGLFLIEGEKAVKEALIANIEIKKIFVLDSFHEFDNENNLIRTTEAVLSKISETKTAPKVIAIAKQINYSLESIKQWNKIILLEGIKDAGNLGSILRTAAAFKIDGIILYGDTVDLYNPKCVRSAVGNLWKVPVLKITDINLLKNMINGHEVIATLPKGENVIELKKATIDSKSIIMFGSEADGLSNELKNIATKNITIEMAQNVESLNLSISVAIIVYNLNS